MAMQSNHKGLQMKRQTARAFKAPTLCQKCEGAGVIEFNNSNPYGYGPDPQQDDSYRCEECAGKGWIHYPMPEDSLVKLSRARRSLMRRDARQFFAAGHRREYAAARATAMKAPAWGQLRMVEAAVGCAIACEDAIACWRRELSA